MRPLASYVCGFTRAWSWSLLLPHPAFPLPAWPTSLGDNTAWLHGVIAGLYLLPFLLTAWQGAAAAALCRMQPIGRYALAITVLPWCLGELTMRLVQRIAPNLLVINQGQAMAALAVQLLALAILTITVRLMTQFARQSQWAIGASTGNNIPTPD